MIAAAIGAVVAAALGGSVLSHGSGTYFALLVALPIIVAPGALVWWQPRLRWFVVWSVVSFVASACLVIFGDPYTYERELPGWHRVELAYWGAMSIAVLGSMAGAFWVAARTPTPVELGAPLARRLRRIVQLVVPIAVVCAVLGFLPGERVYAGNTFLHERSAGGPYLVAFLGLMLLPSILVYRDPRKRWAWLWFAWTLPSSLLVLVTVLGLHIFTRGVALWPMVVVRLGVMVILVLLVLGLPLIAIATRERLQIPEARAR